jgi:hypothetical protein
MAEAKRDLARRFEHVGGDMLELYRRIEGAPRHADRRHDDAPVIEYGSADAAGIRFELLIVRRPTTPTTDLQIFHKGIEVRDRVGSEFLYRDFLDELLELSHGTMHHQGLAQRCAKDGTTLSDDVVFPQAVVLLHLVQVHNFRALERGEEDGLAGDLRKLAKVRLGLRLQLNAVEEKACKLHKARSQPVVPRHFFFFYVTPFLQNAEQPVHRALVKIQKRSDLRQVEPFRLVGKELKDVEGAFNRLYGVLHYGTAYAIAPFCTSQPRRASRIHVEYIEGCKARSQEVAA